MLRDLFGPPFDVDPAAPGRSLAWKLGTSTAELFRGTWTHLRIQELAQPLDVLGDLSLPRSIVDPNNVGPRELLP